MLPKRLTQKIVAGCIAGTDGGKQNQKITKILAIIMFVLGGIGLGAPIFTVVCWGIAILCLVLREKSKKIVQAILEKNYTLHKDICINKGMSTFGDGSPSPYLIFENAGRCEVNFPHAVIISEAVLSVPNLYETTKIGDTVYLLCVKKKRVLYFFNDKFWEIDTEEFSQTGKAFVPNKDFEG